MNGSSAWVERGGLKMAEGNLFQGKLVRLTAENTDTVAEHFSRWNRDSGYWRLLAAEPATPYSVKQIKEFVEKELLSQDSGTFFFMIRSLEDDRIIGEIGLDGVQWNHGDTYVGISIGERELWSKGYGTDAMQVLLRFAFDELNMHRVSLTVFEYNPRAIRSYEKAGFVVEGRERKFLDRDGKRWDVLYMGILREEWLAKQADIAG
jgi:RimJ/RimL family protein N-acetyltransferase